MHISKRKTNNISKYGSQWANPSDCIQWKNLTANIFIYHICYSKEHWNNIWKWMWWKSYLRKTSHASVLFNVALSWSPEVLIAFITELFSSSLKIWHMFPVWSNSSTKVRILSSNNSSDVIDRTVLSFWTKHEKDFLI